MPIYEYRCSSCGFQKEYLQKVSDPQLKVCPECDKETFGKMLTAAGFQLKGGGWYVTDFKNNGAKPAAKSADKNGAASSAESKPSAPDAGGGDAKPAAAAAPAAGTSASAAKAE